MVDEPLEVESPKQLPARFTQMVILICVLPGVAMWMGVDLGNDLPVLDTSLESQALVEQGFSAFSGAFTHTLLEWTAFCIALMTVVLALARFAMSRDVITPVIGCALFASGCMDAFHTLAADRLITAEAANSLLIPFTWAISRTFNSLVCLLGVATFLLMRRERIERLGLGFVASLAAVLGAMSYGIIAYCANSQELPRTMFPDQLITRPWDVYPLFLFVLTAVVLLKYNRRFPSVFSHALLISTIPDLSTQLYMAFGSSQLFDSAFQAAHFTKAFAYAVPCAGLIADYVYTYRAQASTVSLIRRQNEKLAELRLIAEQEQERAERAAASQSTFLATMSHEIRTPMNGVIASADMLHGTHLDQEQNDLVGLIRRSGGTLLTIINDVLDFSKIEAGKLEIEKIAAEPRSILQDVTRMLELHAMAADISLSLSVSDAVPERVIMDPHRVRQVVTNLVSNAVKFTESGGVEVGCSFGRGDADRQILEINVVDSGIGIADPERLFGEFVQADSSTTRRFGGTGLGLTISKRLVELMGGEISVTSVPGQGSEFRVKIPVEEVTQAEMTRRRKMPLAPAQRTGHALLVDDNRINQKVAQKLLSKLGWTADVAGDGAEAVEMAIRGDYALILMDCQMPVMDGYEATRRLRTRGIKTPIVAMTASAMAGDRDLCLRAGMDDYARKPITIPILAELLDCWAPGSSKPGRSTTSPVP